MKLRDLPLRVTISRRGAFPFWVHCKDIEQAKRAVATYQENEGLTRDDVCYPHGTVIDRDGAATARITFEGRVCPR